MQQKERRINSQILGVEGLIRDELRKWNESEQLIRKLLIEAQCRYNDWCEAGLQSLSVWFNQYNSCSLGAQSSMCCKHQAKKKYNNDKKNQLREEGCKFYKTQPWSFYRHK